MKVVELRMEKGFVDGLGNYHDRFFAVESGCGVKYVMNDTVSEVMTSDLNKTVDGTVKTDALMDKYTLTESQLAEWSLGCDQSNLEDIKSVIENHISNM